MYTTTLPCKWLPFIKYNLYFIFLALLLQLHPLQSFAANRYWVSTSSSSWNDINNWSATSGGVGGASVPGSADIAIFNGIVGTNDCSIDATVNVAGIQITGYAGTVFQNGNTITIGISNYQQSSGTFTGDNASITNTGSFTLSNGVFTSTSGTFAQTGNFTFSAGTYNHNNGTMFFNGTQTLGSDVQLYDVTFSTTGSNKTVTITSGKTITVNHNLVFSGNKNIAIANGTLAVKGDIYCNSTISGLMNHSGVILINGTGIQMIYGAATKCNSPLPSININKTSTLILKNYITIEGSLNHIAGTIDHTTYTNYVIFTNNATITVLQSLKNVEFNSSYLIGGMTITIPALVDLIVTDSLRFFGVSKDIKIITGIIQAKGNIYCDLATNATNMAHTGTIRINGIGDQIFDGHASNYNCRMPNIVINKISGTLFLKDYITAEKNWTYTAGTIDYTTYTNQVTFVNTKTITGTHNLGNVEFNATGTGVFTINSGDNVTANGNLYLTGNIYLYLYGTVNAKSNIYCNNTAGALPYVGAAGTIRINGTGNQIFDGSGSNYIGGVPSVVIEKSATDILFLKDFIEVGGHWTYTSGIIDYTTYTNQVTFLISNKSITGTHNLGTVEIYASGSSVYCYVDGGNLVVNGGLYLTGAVNWGLRGTNGTIEAKGDIYCNNTAAGGPYGHTSGLILINGTGNQIINGAAANYRCRLPSVNINKASGTLTLKDYIVCEGAAWTYNAGTIDYSSFFNHTTFIESKTITNSHTLGEVEFAAVNTTSPVFTIASGTTLTANATSYFTGVVYSISINTGTFNPRGDLVLSNTGINGGGNGLILFDGTANQLITGRTTISQSALPNVTINKTGGTLTLLNLLTLQGSSANPTWTYIQGTVDFTTNSTKVAFMKNCIIDGQGTSSTMHFYDIDIPAIGNFTAILSGNLAIDNDLLISNGSALDATVSNYAIEIKGDWNQTSVRADSQPFIERSSTVTFNGTSAQAINNTVLAAGESFYNLVIDNTAGVSITGSGVGANAPVTASNQLTLTNGCFTTGSSKYLIHSNTTAGNLTYTNGYVYGNLRRYIVSNTSTYYFPVANGTLITDRHVAAILNNNLTGVSFINGSVVDFVQSAPNSDASLNTSQGAAGIISLTFGEVVGQTVIWTLTPNAAPSGGNYGVRLFVENTTLTSVEDNYFCPLKRTLTDSYLRFLTYDASTSIPAANAAGRITSSGSGYAERTGYTSFSEHVIGATTVSPLPIELISFDGYCDNAQKVTLNWATASETNNDYFEVQRSVDAINFSTIVNVDGAGNSSQIKQYKYENLESLSGPFYYRLKQTDFDGHFEYSTIVSINCNDVLGDIKVYPNPITNELTIEIEGNNEPLNFEIINEIGAVVYKGSLLNKATVNTTNFVSGVYLIRIEDGKRYELKKIIKE